MTIKLVDDWKSAWKWVSVNCMLVATALQGAWIYVPEDLRDDVPHWLISAITMFILVSGIAGRLIDQPKKKGKK